MEKTKLQKLIAGLQIFASHGCEEVDAQHDEVFCGCYDDINLSVKEAVELQNAGWHYDEQSESWDDLLKALGVPEDFIKASTETPIARSCKAAFDLVTKLSRSTMPEVKTCGKCKHYVPKDRQCGAECPPWAWRNIECGSAESCFDDDRQAEDCDLYEPKKARTRKAPVDQKKAMQAIIKAWDELVKALDDHKTSFPMASLVSVQSAIDKLARLIAEE